MTPPPLHIAKAPGTFRIVPGAFLWAGFPLYNLSVTPDGVPPLLVGEALAFRSVSSSIGNFSAPPEAPLPGELSAKQTERLDEGTAYRCAAALRFSFILCRTTSRQARCTSVVRIQLTG